MKREIHVWDLTTEKIYIQLNDTFRNRFFALAHKKFGSWNKLSDYIGVKRGDTLIATNWLKGKCCYPLSHILKIADKIGIPKETIEANIIEIKSKSLLNKKGGNSGKSIFNPILPIKVDENLIVILGHICGDGCIGRSNPNKGISLKYINSEPTLINEFQETIRKVFGDIEANVQVREGPGYRRKNYSLQYPTILSLFVLSIFDCKSGDEKDVPDFVFQMSPKEKCAFLRALFDDEGCVSIKEKYITIGLKPMHSVKKIRDLTYNLGFSPTKIFYSGINKFIIVRKEDIFRFKKYIGFKHPQKSKKLDFIIKKGWKFDRHLNNEVKDKILLFLRNKREVDIREIAKFLNRHPETTREHLNKLQNAGFIVCRRTKPYFMWRLNE